MDKEFKFLLKKKFSSISTNLPMEIMGFPDFPLETNHSYVHHSVVLNYLHKYAETFNLHRFIHVSFLNRKKIQSNLI